MPYGPGGRNLVWFLLAIIVLELVANVALTVASLK